MLTIQSAQRANTRSSWVTKKEHNASKLDKAQCSFCCYSETHPALSPTHICKIINRCQRSLIQPVYHKHALPTSLHYSIFSVNISGCAALHFFCSIPIAHMLLRSGHKHMQIIREKHQTKLSRAHLCVKTYSFPTEVQLPDNVSHAVMYQYVLTFSPTHWLTLLLPLFSLPFILTQYQYNIYTRQTDIWQFVQFKVFLLSFHCACEMH